jgi:hypothetical protein
MKLKISFKYLFSIVILVLILTACNSEKPIGSQELDKITLEIINRTELPEGISYTIKLSNKSKHLIRQNSVFISYPFKTQNGSKGNEFKVEAKNNKLDIKPNEEIVLNAFTPIEEYKGNTNLLINECYLEIKGYVGQVEEANHFGKTIGMHF